MDLRNKFLKSNPVRLVSISLPWSVQRAKIILALGEFNLSTDVSATSSQYKIQKKKVVCKGYLKLYALQVTVLFL